MKIGFVGMSHLGIVSALGTAEMGINVTAFDHDKSLISNLACGKFTIEEPSIKAIFNRNRKRLNFTSQLQEISDCDLVYISLDIHTDDSNESNLDAISSLISEVDGVLDQVSVLILLSQVPPGFCRKMQFKIQNSLVYQVETLVFGNAFQRYMSPERIIVGLPESSRAIDSIYHQFLCIFNCPILVMSYESAELAKISINVHLAASITATNSMAEIAERISANWSDVRSALVLDRRIGPYAYLTPGLGISGGNIERDLRTTKSLAHKYGTNSELIDSIESNSIFRKLWPARLIMSQIEVSSKKVPLAIWGITYKANTNSIKNSPAIENIRELSKFFNFNIFDPNVSNFAFFDLPVTFFSNLVESLDGVEALLIFNESKQFTQVAKEEFSQRMSRKLIIDPLGVLKELQGEDYEYFTIGSSNSGSTNE